VVAYRMAPLSYAILSRLVKVPWVSLPNLLAGKMLVPELLQDAATPDTLAGAVMAWFDEPERRASLLDAFAGLHDSLRCDASARAADAVLLTVRECQSRQGVHWWLQACCQMLGTVLPGCWRGWMRQGAALWPVMWSLQR